MSAAVIGYDLPASVSPGAESRARLRRWTRTDYHRMAEVGLLQAAERTELLDGEVWTKVSPVGTLPMTAMRAAAEALADAFGDGFEVRLLVEASDSTLRTDQGRKAVLYAQEGIAEYWIVNLVERCVEVRRDPSPQGYRNLTVLTPEQTILPLAAASTVRAGDLLPPGL